MRILIGLISLGTLVLPSCSASYFVDPVSTLVFTATGQGYLQGTLATHNKLFLEGGYALPKDNAVILTRENFAHGFDNDQELTSLALGHFWPNHDSTSSFLVLA